MSSHKPCKSLDESFADRPRQNKKAVLKHISLASFLWDIGKQTCSKTPKSGFLVLFSLLEGSHI